MTESTTRAPISVHENLVSILIPCLGGLEYTRLCVPAVLRYSRDPFEILFLDVASLDGTAEYLTGVRDCCGVHVELLRTPTDLGISSLIDDALRRARGRYLVLLNNDAIVTEHWLEQMIALADSRDDIGMVGPMSNYAAPPQLVESVPYRVGPKRSPTAELPDDFLVDLAELYRFATDFREQHKGKWLMTDRLGGFCLLVKKPVLQQIEHRRLLAEWTDLRLFDTDILSLKVRQVGYQLAVCRDLFVHHFGTRTFAHGAKEQEQQAQTTL